MTLCRCGATIYDDGAGSCRACRDIAGEFGAEKQARAFAFGWLRMRLRIEELCPRTEPAQPAPEDEKP